MADLGVPRQEQWLVSPNQEIKDLWKNVRIQEIKSRIVRHKQDIEDLERGKIMDLTARIKMLELELRHLETKSITVAS